MKDTETNILKAFLAALLQQPEPLPPAIQTQLNQLAPNLEGAIGKLEALAEQYKPLGDSFEASLNFWETRATQRSKSARFLPNDAAEQRLPSSEINNAYQNDRPLLDKYNEVLDQLEKASADAVAKQLKAIAQADDSVQAARDMIVPLGW